MALHSADKSPPAGDGDDLPPPPPPPPPPSRRREREPRDRRDDRDSDRPPSRRDYAGDRGSPPPPPQPRDRDRDRDYKRRIRSPGSPPPRDRRYSSPPPPFKRSRRGSPRAGGYGPEDRSDVDAFSLNFAAWFCSTAVLVCTENC